MGSKEDMKRCQLEKRRMAFYSALVPYVAKYGRAMVRDFYEYWTEENRSHTQMRFEMEKTWEVGKRLARWYRQSNVKNNFMYGRTNKQANREERIFAYANVADDFRKRALQNLQADEKRDI